MASPIPCEADDAVVTKQGQQAPPLTTLQKLAWCLGGFADTIMTHGVLIFALPIYNIALGVPAQWLGWAIAIPRVLDAVVDPIVGNISDNTRTRWGRRRPFIFVGAIAGALLYILIWCPPTSLSKPGLLTWFLISSMAYFFFYAIFSIPNGALGFELSPDTNVRTRIFSLRMVIASTAGFLVPWLYKLTLLPVFGPNEVVGVRFVAAGVAIVILLSALPASFFCREKTASQAQPKVRLGHAFNMTLHNRPFLILAGITFCGLLGVYMVAPLSLYINIYYICGGDKGHAAVVGAYGGMLYSITGLISAPVAAWICVRWGKKNTLMVGLATVIFGFLSSLVCFTPHHPWWLLITNVLICPGFTALWVVSGAMLADLCDVEELDTGLRREGMFGAVSALVIKAGLAGTSVVNGYIILFSGFKEGSPLQTAETLLRLRLMYAFVPIVFMIMGIVLAAMYPITDARVREVRVLLDARKSAGEIKTVGQEG